MLWCLVICVYFVLYSALCDVCCVSSVTRLVCVVRVITASAVAFVVAIFGVMTRIQGSGQLQLILLDTAGLGMIMLSQLEMGVVEYEDDKRKKKRSRSLKYCSWLF